MLQNNTRIQCSCQGGTSSSATLPIAIQVKCRNIGAWETPFNSRSTMCQVKRSEIRKLCPAASLAGDSTILAPWYSAPLRCSLRVTVTSDNRTPWKWWCALPEPALDWSQSLRSAAGHLGTKWKGPVETWGLNSSKHRSPHEWTLAA